MANSKAETFIGFCVKAQKLVLGADALERQKKGVYLLLASKSLSENSFKKAIKFSKKFDCPLMVCENELANATHIQGCKLAAVVDKNLASAIVNSADDNFQIYLGGEN